MEEKNKTKKLTYDELNKTLSELHVQYQKLAAEYQKAMQALQARDFDYTSFYLQTLFKVMEHPEMYKEDFVKWAADEIQAAIATLGATIKGEEPSSKNNEAE